MEFSQLKAAAERFAAQNEREIVADILKELGMEE